MKYQAVKNTLIRQSITVAVVLVVALGVLLFIDSQDVSYTEEVKTLQDQTDKILRDMSTLRDQYAKVDQSAEMYRDIERRNAKNALTLNRPYLRDTFDTLRKQYALNSMKITMSTPQPREGRQYKRDSGFIESSEVAAEFEAVSDEVIFAILRDVQKEMAGVKFFRVAFSTIRLPDALALQAISQQGGYGLVKGEMKFTWFGINLPPPVDPKAAPGAPGAATGVTPGVTPHPSAGGTP